MKKMTALLAMLLAVLVAFGATGGTMQREITPAMSDKAIETTELTNDAGADEEETKEEPAGDMNGGIVYIAGTSEGLGELDRILEDAMIYAEYGEENGASVLNVSVTFNGATVDANFAVRNDKVDLMLPGLTDTCYEFDMTSLMEEVQSFAGEDEDEDEGLLSSLNIFNQNKAKSLLWKYGFKLFGLVSFRSLDWESVDEYTLDELGVTLPCMLLNVTPSREQWEDTLTDILTTAREDETLEEVIEQILRKSYAQSGVFNYDGGEDEFVEEGMDSIYEGIDSALDSMDDIVDTLDGLSCTVALNEGRPCAVIFSKEGQGLVYEGYGDVEDERKDILYLYAEGEEDEDEDAVMILVENSMTLNETEGSIVTGAPAAGVTSQVWYNMLDEENPEINGYLDAGVFRLAASIDLQEAGLEAYAGLNSDEFNAALFVHQEDQHVDVVFPKGEKTVIESIGDLIGLVGGLVFSFSTAA